MKHNRNVVKDGIIDGYILSTLENCDHCHTQCTCIHLTSVTLPTGVKPDKRLISHTLLDSHKDPQPVSHLGIGCGCYAKLHRQLAHITSSQAAQRP